MFRLRMLPLALLWMSCGGSAKDDDRAARTAEPDTAVAVESPRAGVPGPPPRSETGRGPDLSYAQLDLTLDGEAPIRWVAVFRGEPRTFVEDGVLWAPAAAVLAVLAPRAQVTWEAGVLKVDGSAVDVPVRDRAGEAWAAVAPLAHHFGVYARVHPDDGSVVLWLRDALLWLRDHGDPRAPALQEARAAGLLGPGE